MSKKITEKIVSGMRKEKGWSVRHSGQSILLTKIFGVKSARVIQLSLTFVNDKLDIEHPGYSFVNTCAHFKAKNPERRLSLNKAILKSIIHSLKRAGAWKYIQNKDFLLVNDQNKKSNKRKVKDELSNLLKNTISKGGKKS